MAITVDQNGHRVTRDIQREPDGTWGRNVWFGRGCITNFRRYFYRTRMNATQGDISDEVGKAGRVG